MRWECIDWDKRRITVISPKTARHPGGGQRIIPLFPELVSPLNDAYETAPEGAVYVITRHRSQAESEAGWRNSNLRTRFGKIIRRAGLEPWPKPFHAMRASRETELTEKYPVQTAAAWLGNSPAIALKHYLRVLPEHFDRAIRDGTEAAQNQAQCAHARGRSGRDEAQETPENPEKHELLRRHTNTPADGEGLEPVSVSALATSASAERPNPRGAKSGALGAHLAEIPSDLQVVIDAWPTLPEEARVGILAIIEATDSTPSGEGE